MKLLVVALACLAVAAEARFRNMWRYELLNDPQAATGCQFNCNNAANSNNVCGPDNKCSCVKGFEGDYCTCEGRCKQPFGTCNNDAAGSCTCTPQWKGRNCNCHQYCPDSDNWICQTLGDTPEQRFCRCAVDNQLWEEGKKCCPTQCSGHGLSCPKNDGVCHCEFTNTDIPYGSPDSAYHHCCPSYCNGPMCECKTDGCVVLSTGLRPTSAADCTCPSYCNGPLCSCGAEGCIVKATGNGAHSAADCTCPSYCNGPLCSCEERGCVVKATDAVAQSASDCTCPTYCKGPICSCGANGCVNAVTGNAATQASHCQPPQEGQCTKDGGWEECSIVHWQGKCVCDPSNPTNCKCKCWYGWAGGNGTYQNPGWEDGSPSKALYADHCKNRCDWTDKYQPGHCLTCEEEDCPECTPKGAKKCKGTH